MTCVDITESDWLCLCWAERHHTKYTLVIGTMTKVCWRIDIPKTTEASSSLVRYLLPELYDLNSGTLQLQLFCMHIESYITLKWMALIVMVMLQSIEFQIVKQIPRKWEHAALYRSLPTLLKPQQYPVCPVQ